jgi:hypothetical protein
MARNYWMVVLSPENFAITSQQNFSFQGLKGQQGRKVQRVGPGDRVLFYLSHRRCFTATATVTSQCVEAHGLPWHVEGNTEWGYKFDIQPDCVLAVDDYMEARHIAPRLDYVKKWLPEEWFLAFQGNLHLLPKKDFQLLEDEMRKVHRKRSQGGRGDPRQRRPAAVATGATTDD